MVEWQGTGPSADNQNTEFTCGLDGGSFEPCESQSTIIHMHTVICTNIVGK